jgi:hypothetical protein
VSDSTEEAVEVFISREEADANIQACVLALSLAIWPRKDSRLEDEQVPPGKQAYSLESTVTHSMTVLPSAAVSGTEKMRDGGESAHRGCNHSLRRHAVHDRNIDCIAVA